MTRSFLSQQRERHAFAAQFKVDTFLRRIRTLSETAGSTPGVTGRQNYKFATNKCPVYYYADYTATPGSKTGVGASYS